MVKTPEGRGVVKNNVAKSPGAIMQNLVQGKRGFWE